MFKRILSLLAALALTAGVGVAVKFPTLVIGQSSEPQEVSVQAKKPTLVCPGPVFVNGGQNGVTIGSFKQSGSVNIAGQDAGQSISKTESSEATLNGSANGSKNFNAIQVQTSKQQLAAGLSVTNCVTGTNSAWLVAGDNSVGREALLILANPSAVDATVSLQLFGTSGPIQGSGLSGISAPAGKVTVLPLAAFAPKTETFSVLVSSRGASLGMWLQQKTIRGLTPGGLDLVGISAEPSKQVSIPGIFLRNITNLEAMATKDKDFEDTRPIIRITVPGDKAVNFTAQIQGADGGSFGNVVQGTVPAGSTKDFPVEDLTNGNYAVTIAADVPIVASVRYSRLLGNTPDFAWAQSVNQSKLDAGFTAAPGATSKLSMVNATAKPATVSVGGTKYKIDANSNLMIALTAGRHYSIVSSSEVSASQVVDVNGGVAVVPVLDFQSVGGKLKVTVR